MHPRPRFTGPLPPIAVFLICALLLLLVASLVYQDLRAERRANVEASLKAVGQLKLQQLQGWLDERRADIQFVTDDTQLGVQFNRWLNSGGQARDAEAFIRARMAALKRFYNYDAFVLFDPAGQARLASDNVEHAAIHQADALAAMAGGHPRLVDFHTHPGQPIRLGMIAPLTRTNDQAPLGALYLTMDAERHLLPQLRHWPLPSATGETVLARRQGDEILFIITTKTKPMSVRQPITSPDLPTARVLRGEQGILRQARDYMGDPVLAYAIKVPGTPWLLVAKQDQAEVDAPLDATARWLAGAALLLLGTGGGAIWFWWRGRELSYRSRLLAQDLEMNLRQNQADAALRESETRFKQLMDVAPVPLSFVTRDGVLRYFNQRFIDTFGYRQEDIPTLAEWWQLAYPDGEYRDWVLSTWTRAVEGAQARGVDIEPIEYRVTCKNGDVRHMEISGVTLGEDFLASFHDVTERHQLDAERARYQEHLEAEVSLRTRELTQRTLELETANQDLEGFSYSVSHDLRAPLRAIDGFIAILGEDYGDRLDEEGLRLFGVVQDNARKMGQLIDDILAFSRAGRLDLDYVQIDMNSLAQEVWQGLEAQRDDGAAIEFHLQDLPPCQGDPRALRQIWQNLLGNAIKFSRRRAPARIEITAETRDGMLWYAVRDNGVGFNQDYSGKLFGLFQRLHGMDEFEGTGVGLAIVKRFVQKHHGRVEAEGVPDGGATFRFGLPLEPPHAANERSER